MIKGIGAFFMVVYVEYALIQNFLLDGALLYLSLKGARVAFQRRNLLFAAFLGAVFAIVYPLLVLPEFLKTVLKFAVGALLCLLAFGRVKSKNEWGRYALSCFFFYLFTFIFGGFLTALFKKGISPVYTVPVFAFLTPIFVKAIAFFYQKRAVEKHVYDCCIAYNKRSVRILGFLDSGNFARHKNVPVCFVSPELIYELWGEEILEKGRGQVCDEMSVATIAGEKKQKLYKGELQMQTKEGKFTLKEVYFSPSANMLSRGYKLLLNSRIFEENEQSEVKKG